MSTDSDLTIRPGTIVAGKYEVQRVLGEGGVGVVYAARHIRLNRDVALKFLKPGTIEAQQGAELFANEARATFDIVHSHVVRVLDLDRLSDDTPFMVMELLDGCDLRKLLDQRTRFDVASVVELGRQVCSALIAAHARGTVHRDIKPENIFVVGGRLDREVQLKLLDFGISRSEPRTLVDGAASAVATDAKLEQLVSGTPAYMSPEQVSAACELDQRSDVWSLGCVLYELATGIAPFQRATAGQSCHAVLEEEPAPLRAARADLDADLEQIVLRCLHKRASERFASAHELKHALDQLTLSSSSTTRAVLPLTAESPQAQRSRASSLAWLVAGLVVLWMVVFAWAERIDRPWTVWQQPTPSVVRPVPLDPADVLNADLLPSSESESQLAIPAMRPSAAGHERTKRKPQKKSLDVTRAQLSREPDVGF